MEGKVLAEAGGSSGWKKGGVKHFPFPSCHGRKRRMGGHTGGITDRDVRGASPVQ